MAVLVLAREVEKRLIQQRRQNGHDRFDEVWDGIYIMSPDPNIEHQFVGFRLTVAFHMAIEAVEGAVVYPNINVSDRIDNWRKNYRCPDLSVYLPGNPAVDKNSHYLGGPDFAVEVLSSRDRSRKKLDFYAKVGVRELLLVDRKPWSLELYRLIDGALKIDGKILPDSDQPLASQVLPVSFRLLPSDPRPIIEITQTEDARQWLI